MTTIEAFNRINAWQACGYVHPLTCPKCSGDSVATMHNGVWIACVPCGAAQNWIPLVVVSSYAEELERALANARMN